MLIDVKFLDQLINDQQTIIKCFEDKKASEGLSDDEGYTYEKNMGLLTILKDYKSLKNGDEYRSAYRQGYIDGMNEMADKVMVKLRDLNRRVKKDTDDVK